MATPLNRLLVSAVREYADIGPHCATVDQLVSDLRQRGARQTPTDIREVLLDSNRRRGMLRPTNSASVTRTNHLLIPLSEEFFRHFPKAGVWPGTKAHARRYMPGFGTPSPVGGFHVPPLGETSPFIQAYLDGQERVRKGLIQSESQIIKAAQVRSQIPRSEAQTRRQGLAALRSPDVNGTKALVHK